MKENIGPLIVALLLSAFLSLHVNADEGKHKGHYKNNSHKVEHHNRSYRSASPQDNGAPVMAHTCPFSCAVLRIGKDHCRDWRSGNTCFVQDVNSHEVPYRVISPPAYNRHYYFVEPPSYYYGPPQPSAGQIVGDKIDHAIGRALSR